MDCANHLINTSRFLVFGGNGAIGAVCAQAITSVGRVTLGNRDLNDFKFLIESTE